MILHRYRSGRYLLTYPLAVSELAYVIIQHAMHPDEIGVKATFTSPQMDANCLSTQYLRVTVTDSTGVTTICPALIAESQPRGEVVYYYDPVR